VLPHLMIGRTATAGHFRLAMRYGLYAYLPAASAMLDNETAQC